MGFFGSHRLTPKPHILQAVVLFIGPSLGGHFPFHRKILQGEKLLLFIKEINIAIIRPCKLQSLIEHIVQLLMGGVKVFGKGADKDLISPDDSCKLFLVSNVFCDVLRIDPDTCLFPRKPHRKLPDPVDPLLGINHFLQGSARGKDMVIHSFQSFCQVISLKLPICFTDEVFFLLSMKKEKCPVHHKIPLLFVFKG